MYRPWLSMWASRIRPSRRIPSLRMTAPEAEAWLSERLDYLKAVAVWREWADNAEAWNEEDRAAFKKQNREILSRYPDLDIEESSLRYLRSFYNEQHLLAEILEQYAAEEAAFAREKRASHLYE